MLNAQPKPETRKRVKGRQQRHAAKVVKSVRAQCVERDGYCRVWRDSGFSPYVLNLDCGGPSQWAHLGESKRFKTRGKAAEERHTTAGSLMLCEEHHDRYDGRKKPRLKIEGDDANGVLRFVGVSR